jgi:hypothetical protein
MAVSGSAIDDVPDKLDYESRVYGAERIRGATSGHACLQRPVCCYYGVVGIRLLAPSWSWAGLLPLLSAGARKRTSMSRPPALPG